MSTAMIHTHFLKKAASASAAPLNAHDRNPDCPTDSVAFAAAAIATGNHPRRTFQRLCAAGRQVCDTVTPSMSHEMAMSHLSPNPS